MPQEQEQRQNTQNIQNTQNTSMRFQHFTFVNYFAQDEHDPNLDEPLEPERVETRQNQ